MRSRLALGLSMLGAGLLLVPVGALSLDLLGIGAGSPTILAPAGAPLIFPAFMGVPSTLLLSIPAVFYWLLVTSALRGHYAVSRAGLVAFAVLGLLSLAWFIAGWRLGVQYEGALYTRVCFGLSMALAIVALVLGLQSRKAANAMPRLAAAWVMVAWFITYGFAYLGETP